MTINDIIFSARWMPRLCRHLIFWLSRLLFRTAISCYYYHDGKQSLLHMFLSIIFSNLSLNILAVEVPFCYLVVYVLVPRYFIQKKYFSFIVLLAASTVIPYVLTSWYNYNSAHIIGGNLFIVFYMGSKNYFVLGPVIPCIILLCVKIFKTLYQTEREKQRLLKENTDAEMQLLKAQVHPHFLFNTLNNIYSFTINNSPKAGMLVLKLSGMMDYIINECEQAQVPLERELKLLQDYMELEKVRYGNMLTIETIIEGDTLNKNIAPLLMIPFLENTFKHGASKILEQPWIKLSIIIEDSLLRFELHNGIAETSLQYNKKGVGLVNVKKRLELLYHDQYKLSIVPGTDRFSVYMQLPLQKKFLSSSIGSYQNENQLMTQFS